MLYTTPPDRCGIDGHQVKPSAMRADGKTPLRAPKVMTFSDPDWQKWLPPGADTGDLSKAVDASHPGAVNGTPVYRRLCRAHYNSR